MNRLLFGAAAAAALGGASAAFAHHSFAMFDRSKDVTLAGTVKEFQFTNPHSWVQLVVPNPGGGATEWSLELNALVGLRRGGWRPNTLTAGDKVTVVFHPIRDGSHAGQLEEVTLPDGRHISGQANGPGVAAGAPPAPEPARPL